MPPIKLARVIGTDSHIKVFKNILSDTWLKFPEGEPEYKEEELEFLS